MLDLPLVQHLPLRLYVLHSCRCILATALMPVQRDAPPRSLPEPGKIPAPNAGRCLTATAEALRHPTCSKTRPTASQTRPRPRCAAATTARQCLSHAIKGNDITLAIKTPASAHSRTPVAFGRPSGYTGTAISLKGVLRLESVTRRINNHTAVQLGNYSIGCRGMRASAKLSKRILRHSASV